MVTRPRAPTLCEVCGAALEPADCRGCPVDRICAPGLGPRVRCLRCGWCPAPETPLARLVRRAVERIES